MAETVQAQDLTIGVCHSAYQIEPEIRRRLPEVTVFQTFSTEEMKPRMPEIDVLAVSGAWHDSLLENADRLKWIQAGGETSLYETRLVDIMVENIRRWERGEPFIHQVV